MMTDLQSRLCMIVEKANKIGKSMTELNLIPSPLRRETAAIKELAEAVSYLGKILNEHLETGEK